MSAPAPPTPSSRPVALLVAALAMVVAVVAVAALVATLVYFTSRSATAGSGGSAGPAAADAGPYSQEGIVQPMGEGSGVVYYPVPYGSPPHLTIQPKARYLVVKQDEFGFTWLDRARTADAVDLLASVPEVSKFLPKGEAPKFDPGQPELVWEARGVRAAPGTQPMKLFEQTGKFVSDFGQQGQVNFPYPYASPPNVELSGNSSKTVITECTATGFKWKNGNTTRSPSWDAGEVTWKASGIRAAQVPKG